MIFITVKVLLTTDRTKDNMDGMDKFIATLDKDFTWH